MASSLLITIAVTFCVLSVASAATLSCKSDAFSGKDFTDYDSCMKLPTLDAVLHGTYDPDTSAFSMAFTAPPPSPDGWVSWALNPSGTGMVGAQALIAFKPDSSSSAISVASYDIQSYKAIVKGPISYNLSHVSAQESGGLITIFATWQLPKGSKTVNQVWQVGPVVNGRVGKHDFEPANLESMMELDLVGEAQPVSGPTGAPVVEPAPVGSPESGGPNAGASAPMPAKGGAGKVGFGVPSLVLGFGALFVSLF